MTRYRHRQPGQQAPMFLFNPELFRTKGPELQAPETKEQLCIERQSGQTASAIGKVTPRGRKGKHSNLSRCSG